MEPSVAATPGRSHIAPVTSREELIYLLSRASELEHGLSCVYLYAAYSLKSDVKEGGLTPEQMQMVRRWKRRLAAVAVEEMLHLAQVANLLTAIGGAPHFRRKNFPQPASAFPIGIPLSLEPFSESLIERLVCYEAPEAGILSAEQQALFDSIRARIVQRPRDTAPSISALTEPFDIDFATVGEFYHKIETGFRSIPENELFIGPRQAQANARFIDFAGKLIRVVDRESACAAIKMIVEQGEAPTSAHPDAHFFVFDAIRAEYAGALKGAGPNGTAFAPVRPVASNPMTRFYDDASGGTLITDEHTHEVADLFNVAYDTMLIMLMRFFAHTQETEAELEHLARATLLLMTTVLRPLGEALTKLPMAGAHFAGMTAGPGFGYNLDIHLLPHKRSAWVFFGERLRQLASAATRMCLSDSSTARADIEEAAAALQDLSEQFAPADRTWNAVAQETEFRTIESGKQRSIALPPNGPLLVSNVAHLISSRGETIRARPEMALCRCGGSANKPFCDGTHARIGFTSEPDPGRTPDGVADYAGDEITVHFNRLQCAASEQCSKNLAAVFREGEQPWIRPNESAPLRIIEVIRRCPSGALRYTYRGHTGPAQAGGEPAIRICRDGPYEVRGAIALQTDQWPAGASHDRYTLCRCGASKNKPFCDGSHWRIGFKDDRN